MKIAYLIPLIGVSSLLLGACTLSPKAYAPAPSPSPAVMVKDTSMPPASKVYALAEQNSSGQTGTLTLTETPEGKTTAVLALMGGKFTTPQPAHIHVGTCPKPGAAQFPLTDVVDGQSVTTLDMPLADVLAAAPELAVNVHKSASEISAYTACGDLK